ncbi:MAG TPA: hypothetical protein VGJ86_06260 [Acidimicrobiales bacterium]|jgi:hypothetical protein
MLDRQVRVGRLLAILAGLGMLVLGGITLLNALAGVAVAGFDNRIDTGSTALDSPTAAIASGVGELGGDWVTDWPTNRGKDFRLHITTTARDGKTLFVGLGSTDQVRTYLDQQVWDDLDAFSSKPLAKLANVSVVRQGLAEPASLPSPGDQPIWITRASGVRTELVWDTTTDGQWLVVMSADGSPGLATDTTIELEIPSLTTALGTAVLFGIFVSYLGWLLLTRVARDDDL